MRYKALLFGALVLIGVCLYGYGLTVPSHTHHVDVDGPVDADTVDENATVTNYEGLSAEKQQVFDEARNSNTTVATTAWHSEDDFVRYQGAYYQVDSGGVSTGNNIVYFGVGIVVTWFGVIGLSVLGLYWAGRRFDGRRVLYWIGRKFQRLRHWIG